MEEPHTSADLRALSDAARPTVLAVLGIDAQWAVALQDGWIDSVFKLCQQASWVLVTNLSQGLLTAARIQSLAFLRGIRTSSPNVPTSSRARMASLLSPAEFHACEVTLRASGRSFDDIEWTGSSWTLRPVGAGTGGAGGAQAGGVAGGSAVGGGGGSGSGATASTLSTVSGFSSVSHVGADAGRATLLSKYEKEYHSLAFDPYLLMTPAENAEVKQRVKAAVGAKRERAWEGEPDADSDALTRRL